jgi:NTE family protein
MVRTPMIERPFALVLSGGGVTGMAWETALLKGLRDAGVDLTSADLIIGTSAGSILGTQIASGIDLDTLCARQLQPTDPRLEPTLMVNFLQELAKLGPELALLSAGAPKDEPGLPQALRAAIGRHALEAETPGEEEGLAMSVRPLAVSDWPERPLKITAVDVENGDFVVWDRTSGVDLPKAVASSCSVPMVYPPVSIKGRRYMDGGLRSPTNADLAVDYASAVIITPISPEHPGNRSLAKELRVLEQSGAAVVLLRADAESIASFGPNAQDPAFRPAAAKAGLRQAGRMAGELRAKLETAP